MNGKKIYIVHVQCINERIEEEEEKKQPRRIRKKEDNNNKTIDKKLKKMKQRIIAGKLNVFEVRHKSLRKLRFNTEEI